MANDLTCMEGGDDGSSARFETIGLLFVHGIGEQARYEHITAEMQQIVTVLERDVDRVSRISVRRAADPDAESPSSEELEPSVIVEYDWSDDDGTKRVRLEAWEVYWADLDERNSLRSRLRLWTWAFGQWVSRRKADPAWLSDSDYHAPGTDRGFVAFRSRAYLLLVCMFLFQLWTLSGLIGIVASLSQRKSGVRLYQLLASYLGDVMLYLQQQPITPGLPLSRRVVAPRVEIRRRMVQTMVRLVESQPDRWYVLGHSLGSIVSFNGLAESGHGLASLMDETWWEQARNAPTSGIQRDLVQRRATALKPKATLEIPRPVWLDPTDQIDRAVLFEKLTGYVTYGSPLDKFAFVWPGVVPNNPAPAFPNEFWWDNLRDPTDAIAGSLESHYLQSHSTSVGPRNIAVRSSPVLILSHLKYLASGRVAANRAVSVLAEGISRGGPAKFDYSGADEFIGLEKEKKQMPWAVWFRVRRRVWWTLLQWFLFYMLFTLAAAGLATTTLAHAPKEWFAAGGVLAGLGPHPWLEGVRLAFPYVFCFPVLPVIVSGILRGIGERRSQH